MYCCLCPLDPGCQIKTEKTWNLLTYCQVGGRGQQLAHACTQVPDSQAPQVLGGGAPYMTNDKHDTMDEVLTMMSLGCLQWRTGPVTG